MDARSSDEVIEFVFLAPGDICNEVHIIWMLGEPLFDCLLEDAVAFLIQIVEDSFHPMGE